MTVTVGAGQHVDITLGIDLNTADNVHPMQCQMILTEDGSPVLNNVFTIAPNAVSPDDTDIYGTFLARRSPSAGAHTYTLEIANQSSTTTVNWSQATVRAYVVSV